MVKKMLRIIAVLTSVMLFVFHSGSFGAPMEKANMRRETTTSPRASIPELEGLDTVVRFFHQAPPAIVELRRGEKDDAPEHSLYERNIIQLIRSGHSLKALEYARSHIPQVEERARIYGFKRSNSKILFAVLELMANTTNHLLQELGMVENARRNENLQELVDCLASIMGNDTQMNYSTCWQALSPGGEWLNWAEAGVYGPIIWNIFEAWQGVCADIRYHLEGSYRIAEGELAELIRTYK